MSRELLLRFVDERASLAEDELEALARALAGDPALRADARAQLATHELLDRVLSPARRGLAARVAAALAAGRAPATSGGSRGRRRSAARRPGGIARWWFPTALAAAALALTVAALTQRLDAGHDRPLARIVAARAARRVHGGVDLAARDGDALAAGDAIAVEPGGAVELRYRDGTALALDGDRAALRLLGGAGKPLRLDRGRLVARVARQAPGAPLTVATDEAVCTVVGTRFTLVRADAATRLTVDEGAVAMRRDDVAITVGAGESAVAARGVPLAARAAPRALTAAPDTLAVALRDLRPGDTLTLAPGDYPDVSLALGGLRGETDAWITIAGPDRGAAVLHAATDANTLEIGGAHHLALRRLTFDGGRRHGAYAIAAHEGGPTHDIRIEDCVIRGYAGWSGAVAISSKRPAWSWTIRGCVIERCGAGLHLGGFDDGAPFAAGAIVGNRIATDERCAIEIIAGTARPAGAPPTARTLIADNVLTREAGAPPSPLVTIDGGGVDAAGDRERIELARDAFLGDGGSASLLLAAGALDVHDCVFAGAEAAAIALRTRGAPTDARIWHDTIVACAQGVHAPEGAHRTFVAHCLICADDPVVGVGVTTSACRLATRADAAGLVTDATPSLGSLDLHPRLPACRAEAWDARALGLDARDFDGDARTDAALPGAYAGPATARSWRLAPERKPAVDR